MPKVDIKLSHGENYVVTAIVYKCSKLVLFTDAYNQQALFELLDFRFFDGTIYTLLGTKMKGDTNATILKCKPRKDTGSPEDKL